LSKVLREAVGLNIVLQVVVCIHDVVHIKERLKGVLGYRGCGGLCGCLGEGHDSRRMQVLGKRSGESWAGPLHRLFAALGQPTQVVHFAAQLAFGEGSLCGPQ